MVQSERRVGVAEGASVPLPVPIARRVVEADLEVVIAARLDKRPHEIAATQMGPRAQIAELARPQGVAIVMPRCQHSVAKS